MATAWKVDVLPSAQRELDALAERVRFEAVQAILDLSEEPIPQDALELEGHRHAYRIRCHRDQYRIVYRVSEQQRRVLILRVRLRASAYDGL